MGALDTWDSIAVWLGTEKHKWKMTDKPHKVARKFGFKKFDAIWSDASNKKLKSSRKKPENIKKGDVVVIPPSPSDRAKIKAKIIDYATTSAADHHELSTAHTSIATQMEMASKALSKILKSQQNMFKKADYLLADARKNLKQVADGVDVAKDLIDLTRGLASLANNTRKALKAPEAKLKEINSKGRDHAQGMLVKSGKMLADTTKLSLASEIDKAAKHKGMQGEGRALQDTLNKINKYGFQFGTGDLMNKAYDNIQKPSFVALTISSLKDGKSWSESVTRDLDDELKQLRLRNKITILKSMGRVSAHKKWVDDQAKLYRGSAKASLKQAKAYEKNLASYKKL